MTVCVSNGVPFKFTSQSRKHSRFVTSVDVRPPVPFNLRASAHPGRTPVRPKWLPLRLCWQRRQRVPLRRHDWRRQEHARRRHGRRAQGHHLPGLVRQGLGSNRHLGCRRARQALGRRYEQGRPVRALPPEPRMTRADPPPRAERGTLRGANPRRCSRSRSGTSGLGTRLSRCRSRACCRSSTFGCPRPPASSTAVRFTSLMTHLLNANHLTWKSDQTAVTALAHSPSTGDYLSGDSTGVVRRFSSRGVCSPVGGAGHSNLVVGIIPSGGDFFSTSYDDSVKVLSTTEYKCVAFAAPRFCFPNLRAYRSTSLSTGAIPKGIAAGSAGTVYLATAKDVQALANGQKVASLAVSYGPTSIAASQDGTFIAVGGEDSKCHVYSTKTKGTFELVAELPLRVAVTSCAFSPDSSVRALLSQPKVTFLTSSARRNSPSVARMARSSCSRSRRRRSSTRGSASRARASTRSRSTSREQGSRPDHSTSRSASTRSLRRRRFSRRRTSTAVASRAFCGRATTSSSRVARMARSRN